jgi:hypothetical protein
VVVVDYLEHIETDRQFVRELHRILRPGGTLLVNVPHLKPRSLINRIRHLIGLTDERHGHVRPGYSRDGLARLLHPEFRIVEERTYSRSFSEAIDTGLNGLYLMRGVLTAGHDRSKKGTVVTADAWTRHRTEFLLLTAMFPFLWLVSKLDMLLFLQPGYKLIVKARRNPDGPIRAVD